jgi:hypothetical protein
LTLGNAANWLLKFNVNESNGITDCVKTVVGLFPDIGYSAHDLENLDLDHATDMYNHINSIISAAGSVESDCAGLI